MTGPGRGLNSWTLPRPRFETSPRPMDAQECALEDALGGRELIGTSSLREFFDARAPYVKYAGMLHLSGQRGKRDPRLKQMRERYVRARNSILRGAADASRPHAHGMSIAESERYRNRVARALIDGEQKHLAEQDPGLDSVEPLLREERLLTSFGTRLRGNYPEESVAALENLLDEHKERPKLAGVAGDLDERDAQAFFEKRRAAYAARFANAADDKDPDAKDKIRAYDRARHAALARLSGPAQHALAHADKELERLLDARGTTGARRAPGFAARSAPPAPGRVPITRIAPEPVPSDLAPKPPVAPSPAAAALAAQLAPESSAPTPEPVPPLPAPVAEATKPPRRVITLADDPEELAKVMKAERSAKPGQTIAPEDADLEELAADLAEDGVPLPIDDEKKESGSRTTRPVRLERGAHGEPVVVLPDGPEEYSVNPKGALPFDTVEIAEAEDGKSEYEVVAIKERYPHRTVATARLEKDGTLVAHADNRIVRRPIPLPDGFVDAAEAPKGLRVALVRERDPAKEEWVLDEVIGEAGRTLVEQDAMAMRTPNGPKRVEDLTEEDIRRFAGRLDRNEYPLLKAPLESFDFAAFKEQLRSLETLAQDVENGKVPTDELVGRLLPKHEAGAPLYADTLEGYEHGKNRVDRREIPMLVMDPADAKDHDDGLMYHELPDKRVEVGVPIADPTAFIPEGSPLDLLAQFREMTQYLPKTLPLFPAALAESLGSLKEGKERLSFMMFLTYPPRAEWPDPDTPPAPEVRFAKAAVKSQKFVSYEEGQALLDGPDGDEWGDRLKFLNLLATHYGGERDSTQMRSRQELRFQFGPDGEPAGVRELPILPANRLIEQFAVTANYEAVKALANAAPGAIAMIRFHAPPKPEKMLSFLESAGYEKLWKDEYLAEPEEEDEEPEMTRAGAHELMKEIRGRLDAEPDERARREKEERLVRAMTKAGYTVASEEEIGEEEHFGLALRYYGHYTSPIRRYPDIVQHRLLDRMLAGNPVVAGTPEAARYAEIAALANEREKGIDRAERDMNEFLALTLFERDLAARTAAEGKEPGIEAEVVMSEGTSATVRLTLPGEDKVPFDVRVSRNAIRDSGGKKLSGADWDLVAKTRGPVPFEVRSVDPTLRRLSLQVDTDALYNRHGLERLKKLPIGTELVAEIGSVEGGTTARALIRSKNNRPFLKSYEIPLDRIGLAEGELEAIAAGVEEGSAPKKRPHLLLRVGPLSQRSGLPRLQLVKAILPERQKKPAQERRNPIRVIANRFLETYKDQKGKEHQKLLRARVIETFPEDNEITAALVARGAPKSYVIARTHLDGITDEEWKNLKAGDALSFLVKGIFAGDAALSLRLFRKGENKEKKPRKRRKRKSAGEGADKA